MAPATPPPLHTRSAHRHQKQYNTKQSPEDRAPPPPRSHARALSAAKKQNDAKQSLEDRTGSAGGDNCPAPAAKDLEAQPFYMHLKHYYSKHVLASFLLLAALGGWLPLAPAAVATACLASAGWLALVWYLHRSGSLAPTLRRLDHGLRHAVVAVAALAGLALLLQSIAGPRWLGVKLLAYAGAVLMGLMLRGVLAEWGRGFAELREPATVPAGNARIARAAGPSRRYAWALWACVLLAALMGVTKPF